MKLTAPLSKYQVRLCRGGLWGGQESVALTQCVFDLIMIDHEFKETDLLRTRVRQVLIERVFQHASCWPRPPQRSI